MGHFIGYNGFFYGYDENHKADCKNLFTFNLINKKQYGLKTRNSRTNKTVG